MQISKEEWARLAAYSSLPIPFIKKSCNIIDYKWDEAWRSIRKELGDSWDRKALFLLKKHAPKDVVLTARFSCTLFNENTIMVYSTEDIPLKKQNVEVTWNEDDFVKSQLQ